MKEKIYKFILQTAVEAPVPVKLGLAITGLDLGTYTTKRHWDLEKVAGKQEILFGKKRAFDNIFINSPTSSSIDTASGSPVHAKTLAYELAVKHKSCFCDEYVARHNGPVSQKVLETTLDLYNGKGLVTLEKLAEVSYQNKYGSIEKVSSNLMEFGTFENIEQVSLVISSISG